MDELLGGRLAHRARSGAWATVVLEGSATAPAGLRAAPPNAALAVATPTETERIHSV